MFKAQIPFHIDAEISLPKVQYEEKLDIMQFFETIASLFTIKCLNYAVFLLNFKFYLLQKQKTGALSS